MQSANTLTQHVIVKSSRRSVFARLVSRSTKYCLKTKIIALSLPNSTIRSRDRTSAKTTGSPRHEPKIWQLKFQFANDRWGQPGSARSKNDAPLFNRFSIQRRQRRRFSKKGIGKNGFGQWTAILSDPDFLFQKGRLADSLKKRAELLKPNN